MGDALDKTTYKEVSVVALVRMLNVKSLRVL